MNNLIISISPYGTELPNKYIERMELAIKMAKPESTIIPFPGIRNIFKLRKCDYVWVNWFENLPKESKIKAFLIKKIILYVIKVLRIKLVATYHNRMPHESQSDFWDRKIFKDTFCYANRIIALSSDSTEIIKERFGSKVCKKVKIIPHPTYDCKPRTVFNNNAKFKVLFFGHLRPYKNIEMIFELAKHYPDIPFTVAGSPLNNEYAESLKRLTRTIPNVKLILKLLSTKEIDSLIDKNSVLLLPYDIKSSLNSGVVIHAICKKINVIVPKIGTVNQLINKDMIFSYSYNSPESHMKELKRLIEQAKNEYDNNIDNFNNRIKVLYDEVMSAQSIEKLASYISEVFV